MKERRKAGVTSKEAIRYIENYTWSPKRLGVDRERELLGKIGNPQKKLRFVHVAGSNGKGSTCAMLAKILQEAGYQTGLYTSPYIEDFCERMQVNGVNISGASLAEITEKVAALAEQMAERPSQFELVTAIAMEFFFRSGCEIVVLEVGLGGALDATNVIDAPEAAVITNIGLEHTEFLGNTLEEIAANKAGIIKKGSYAVCYDGAPEVTEVIRNVCKEQNVPLRCVNSLRMKALNETLGGQDFLWDDCVYHVSLLGPHQLKNAATVLETVDALRERGWRIPDSAVQNGLRTVFWPARLEIMGEKPLFLLDGGHNPQCAEALADAVKKLLSGRRVVVLLGVLADKDFSQIADIIIPCAEKFVCVTPESGRALPAEQLAAFLREKSATAIACGSDMKRAIHTAMEEAGENGAVVAFGSLYLAGHVRTVYRQMIEK